MSILILVPFLSDTMASQARVFLVGATGFVGGDILHQVFKSFPSARVSALVRNAEKSKALIATYPQIELRQGTLDSAEVIEEEAASADVVISAADFHHHGLADSISRGILKSTTPSPTTWLQISGSSIVAVPDIIKGRFGEHSDDEYNDYEGADAIRTFIQNTPSRYVDRLVQNFSAEHADKVKAALIFPPIIYGVSRSLGNTRSIQIPDLCKHAITNHEALFVGKGEARWGHTHVADVSQLVIKLMEASLDGKGPQEELWNKNGLYFTTTGEMVSGI